MDWLMVASHENEDGLESLYAPLDGTLYRSDEVYRLYTKDEYGNPFEPYCAPNAPDTGNYMEMIRVISDWQRPVPPFTLGAPE